MNREILFKAKRKLNGKWVFGSLISIGNDWCQIITANTEYDDISQSMSRVITDTVCQFTGLTDKNGTKIFEGDILPGGYKVEYLNGGFFGVRHKKDKYVHSLKKCSQLLEFIVIGNIHDNPALLESSF